MALLDTAAPVEPHGVGNDHRARRPAAHRPSRLRQCLFHLVIEHTPGMGMVRLDTAVGAKTVGVLYIGERAVIRPHRIKIDENLDGPEILGIAMPQLRVLGFAVSGKIQPGANCVDLRPKCHVIRHCRQDVFIKCEPQERAVARKRFIEGHNLDEVILAKFGIAALFYNFGNLVRGANPADQLLAGIKRSLPFPSEKIVGGLPDKPVSLKLALDIPQSCCQPASREAAGNFARD